MRKIYLAPSILTCPKDLVAKKLEEIGNNADFLHFDVMDGIFVPKKSFDSEFLACVSKHHNLVNDVHLMVANPNEMVESFAKNGADFITVHVEAFDNDEKLIECVNNIHSFGCKAGISIKPKTPVWTILPLLEKVDMILVMSVEPGLGGQKFMDHSLEKIKELRNYIDTKHLNVLIEVDGGINVETCKKVVDAGIDVIVSGSFIFDHDNVVDRIKLLKVWE